MSWLLTSQKLMADIQGMSLRFRPKTADAINKMRTLGDAFINLTPSEVLLLQKDITKDLSFKLMYLGTLSAEEAINTDDREWVRVGIAAHAIEGFKFDFRENFLRLHAIEYAAFKTKSNALEIAASMRYLLSEQIFGYLMQSLEGNFGEKSLKLACLKEVIENDRVRFVPA